MLPEQFVFKSRKPCYVATCFLQLITAVPANFVMKQFLNYPLIAQENKSSTSYDG